MKPNKLLPDLRRWGSLLALLAGPALLQAQPVVQETELDGPGPVGRVAAVQGQVFTWEPELRAWAPAEPGRPVGEGDRISTGPVGRSELHIGSTTLRLHSRTELDVVQLDAQGLVLALRSGSLALRVHNPAAAARTEIVTPEARLQPLGPGHFRFDRGDAASGEQNHRTQATAWHGRLRVLGEDGFDVASGDRVALWLDGAVLRHVWDSPADDVFAERVQREDAQAGRVLATAAPVPAELTGAADLARHGRWTQHPQWGPVWWPSTLHASWTPYQHGRWVWVQPWGWTWVDQAHWAFATYHYGSWLQWQGRWVWAPRAPREGYAWRDRKHRPDGPPHWRDTRHPPHVVAPQLPAAHQRPPAGRGEWRSESRPDERRDWRMRMPQQPAQQPVQPVQHQAQQPVQQPRPPQGWRNRDAQERPRTQPGTGAAAPAPPVRSAANPAEPDREHQR